MSLPSLGALQPMSATGRPDLLGAPVAAALSGWPHAADVAVVEIDPDLADTAAMTEAYGVPLTASANCVVVAGRRDGGERVAACVVRADTRADVNNLVKRTLDVRKASFLAMDRAVEESGMEYGGITPVGLPDGWRGPGGPARPHHPPPGVGPRGRRPQPPGARRGRGAR